MTDSRSLARQSHLQSQHSHKPLLLGLKRPGTDAQASDITVPSTLNRNNADPTRIRNFPPKSTCFPFKFSVSKPWHTSMLVLPSSILVTDHAAWQSQMSPTQGIVQEERTTSGWVGGLCTECESTPVTYPADIACNARLSLQALHQCHQQWIQTVLVDDGIRQHLTHSAHCPSSCVTDHNTSICQQLNQHGHRLLHNGLELLWVRAFQDGT